MPLITRIAEQNRKPSRRNTFLDGRVAVGLNPNTVAKFRVREGLELSPAQVKQIEFGERRQEVFDHAMRFLQRRLQSRSELRRKLQLKDYPVDLIDDVLDELAELGY